MPRFYDLEQGCEECGQPFWSCRTARFCSQRCRKRSWRTRRALLHATDLAALCSAFVTKTFPLGTTSSQALGRLLRGAAAELRRHGEDPLELLIATPDEPVHQRDGETQSVEGRAPERRRYRLTAEEEIEALNRAIATREANGHPTHWHHERRALLARRLLGDISAQLAAGA